VAEPIDQLTDKEHAIRERIEAKLGAPPERDKPVEEWTPDDHLEHRRTGAAPESAEHAAYRAAISRAAGLEPDEKTIEEMTPADHFERITRRNG
jgi:hypothetical protein